MPVQIDHQHAFAEVPGERIAQVRGNEAGAGPALAGNHRHQLRGFARPWDMDCLYTPDRIGQLPFVQRP
ncbi:hypothetical protein D3C81_1102640 [compost metagenome]